jgi:hypothetical protein
MNNTKYLILRSYYGIYKFRNTWWKGHCAGAVLVTQSEEKCWINLEALLKG